MLVVSHDREFLDKVCNKIVDVEDGVTVSYTGKHVYNICLGVLNICLFFWVYKLVWDKNKNFIPFISQRCLYNIFCTGNYSQFLEQRRARLLQWRERYEKQQRYIKEEERLVSFHIGPIVSLLL